MNKEKEEIALLNIERNNALLALVFGLSALVLFAAYKLLNAFNPWGFIVAIPGCILLFQSLWLMLNPFAKLFADRFEIHQSFLRRKSRYFVDIKKISDNKNGSLYLTFNDDEIEKISLGGIRHSQIGLLKEEISKKVEESLRLRA